MDKETFKKLAGKYSAIPVFKRLLADVLTPVSLFMNVREGASYPFLLESVEGGENLARYSFIGRNPFKVLTFDGQDTFLMKEGSGQKVQGSYFDILEEMTTEYSEPDMPDLPRLRGGAVGFSSYDTIREVETLSEVPPDDLNLPEAVWAFYDEIFAFDHVKHQVILIKTVFIDDDMDLDQEYDEALKALNIMETDALSGMPTRSEFSIDTQNLTSNLELDEFTGMVEKGKKYIYEGDIFQVVLSQRFETSMSGDPFMLYRALRMVNPSPYLFFLDFDDFHIVGSSPEVLVRVQDRKVTVLPIAGTRPRGKDYEEDLRYEQDLLNDPKEVAEHVMLVDLGRNDVSRVSETGSVQLERNQVIERYSHVMHIVSEVTGKLNSESSPVDALKRCFPAGTVSGAPKIRAMQIIDELEPNKRGIYAGAIGYFDYSGNMDTCIAIRTMVVTGNKVYIQAGAGIVADSNPQKEFEETQNKAGALIQALSVALDIQ
ncbi:anthranilate synthase component I [Balneola sp. MJW-20]|uniref:anthranilate synthase component I n=1 Tax=Gracilimonas aurantiaca TaxID=3234185 RepID=UPI00346657A1